MESKSKSNLKKGKGKEESKKPVAKSIPSPAKKEEKPSDSEDMAVPKKPRTAYILFTMAKRAEVLSENPDLKAKEVLKALGKLWNKLSDSEKQPYYDQSTAEKQRYEKQAKDLKSTGKSIKKRKNSEPSVPPKRKATSKSKKD